MAWTVVLFTTWGGLAAAAEPTVQVISATPSTATVVVTSGEITETATLALGETATVAKQRLTLAYIAEDKVVMAINGTSTTLTVGTSAIAVAAPFALGPAAAGAAVIAGGLAATGGDSTTSHSTSHSAATHH